MERFYDGIGGIVGYQRKALELIAGEAGEGGDTAVETRLHRPAGPDLSDTCEGGPGEREENRMLYGERATGEREEIGGDRRAVDEQSGVNERDGV